MATDKWISVYSKLPDEEVEVWVHGKEGVTIGEFCPSPYDGSPRWFDVYGDSDGLRDDVIYKVTHWQPMLVPEPPAEEQTNGN